MVLEGQEFLERRAQNSECTLCLASMPLVLVSHNLVDSLA